MFSNALVAAVAIVAYYRCLRQAGDDACIAGSHRLDRSRVVSPASAPSRIPRNYTHTEATQSHTNTRYGHDHDFRNARGGRDAAVDVDDNEFRVVISQPDGSYCIGITDTQPHGEGHEGQGGNMNGGYNNKGTRAGKATT
jgi:hypothetical protein